MLYHLLHAFRDDVSALNVVRYITFRTAVASLTALFLVLVLGPWMIERLRRLQIGQYIREEGPQAHRAKAGTPTMGGLLILTGIVVPTLLWADLTNRNVWILVLATVACGAIGFADDYLKVVKKRSLGLTARKKLLGQVGVGFLVGVVVYVLSQVDPVHYANGTRVVFPFFKELTPDLSVFYVIFAILVIVGSTNAVNLTDGLDGLAIGSTLIAAAAFTVLAYVSGHRVFSDYLDLLYLSGVGEVTVFCGAMVGASMGFLWWNCYPAHVFMGDVGSLSLGGALGTVAILIKQELLLIAVGGLFVLEALSVILQVASFKLTGRRVFRMAPLHHHFELLGWKEPQVIIRFWIIAFVFALFSLTTLKLR
jgi:phospho-N-acetylmuramoyl-pentapeptide-transferase